MSLSPSFFFAELCPVPTASICQGVLVKTRAAHRLERSRQTAAHSVPDHFLNEKPHQQIFPSADENTGHSERKAGREVLREAQEVAGRATLFSSGRSAGAATMAPSQKPNDTSFVCASAYSTLVKYGTVY